MNTRAALVGVAMAAGVLWLTRGVGVFGDNPGTGAEGGDEEAEEVSLIEQAVNVATNTVMNPTSLSAGGLELIKRFEGFSATAYPDHKGSSIGYGHLIRAGEALLDAVISEAQAAELLALDVGWAERAVTAAVSASLTQEQFDALVSLCFNIGESAFKKSTLVRLLNEGDYAGAADQFGRWVRASGQVNTALVGRRGTEEAMFRGGIAA